MRARRRVPSAPKRARVTADSLLRKLRGMANAANVAGMARFGIRPGTPVFGISIWELRKIAKAVGRDHGLAQRLWASRIHEARILASFVEMPEKVTEAQMERWVGAFDAWDICDQVVEVFSKTPHAKRKVRQWSRRKEEYVKRAAFALIAELAVHDRDMTDREFERLLPVIAREATDDRNFVKKAVSWALRGIGKRNETLNTQAIETARILAASPSRSARWVGSDALRELTGPAVQARLRRATRRSAAR